MTARVEPLGESPPRAGKRAVVVPNRTAAVSPDVAAEISAAWESVTGRSVGLDQIGRRDSGPRCRVYVLHAAGISGETIIAKASDRRVADHESRAYRELLPRIPTASVSLWGLVPSAGSRRSWVFIDDAGARK